MTAVIPELRETLLAAADELLVKGAEPSSTPAGRARRHLRRGGLPLVVALLVGTSGIAAATGLVVSQATKDRAQQLTRESAPAPGAGFATLGERMARTAREVRAQLPYPPGMPDTYDWSRYSAGATLGTGGETRREIQLMSEFRASCLWRRYYLARHDAGDRQGMADAAAILAQAPDWPATRGLPGRRSGPARPDDPLVAFARAAARGEATEAMRTYVAINCIDGVDRRLREGETQAQALARVKREAARATAGR